MELENKFFFLDKSIIRGGGFLIFVESTKNIPVKLQKFLTWSLINLVETYIHSTRRSKVVIDLNFIIANFPTFH